VTNLATPIQPIHRSDPIRATWMETTIARNDISIAASLTVVGRGLARSGEEGGDRDAASTWLRHTLPVDDSDRSIVRAYYAGFAEREWQRLERSDDGAVEFAVTTAALERHLESGSRILDIGGGPGRYSIWLATHGHSVTLADLSPELLVIARERVASAGVRAAIPEIVEADATDLSRWPSERFDAVLSLGPFYHLVSGADRHAAARELARVTRPGGHVFVAVMPRLAFLKRTIGMADERHHLLDKSWMRALLDDGVFENEVPGRFSLGYGVRTGEIEALLREHGFDVIEVLSVESLSVGIEAEVGKVIEEGGPTAATVLRSMTDHAADPELLGASGHLLVIGRRDP
jgi:2-polyprenyl-3-methyl-5-hydroxy-6-metoxy-1,4-benzoquinol methylase